jgi:hypothetical protein
MPRTRWCGTWRSCCPPACSARPSMCRTGTRRWTGASVGHVDAVVGASLLPTLMRARVSRLPELAMVFAKQYDRPLPSFLALFHTVQPVSTIQAALHPPGPFVPMLQFALQHSLLEPVRTLLFKRPAPADVRPRRASPHGSPLPYTLSNGGAGTGGVGCMARAGRPHPDRCARRVQKVRARRTGRLEAGAQTCAGRRRVQPFCYGEHDVDEMVWLEGSALPREQVLALEIQLADMVVVVRHP